MTHNKYCIGVDYGTDSVRCIIVDAANRQEMASSVFYYPRWKDGLYCDSSVNQFRQHPLDYIEGLEYVIKRSLAEAGPGVRQISNLSSFYQFPDFICPHAFCKGS